MSADLYLFFLVTTVMLILVPGPAAITVVRQAASGNSKRAIFSVLGVASGDAVFFILSATGIASLIVASSVVFSLIKWFGVAYLLFLGVSALFSKVGTINIHAQNTKLKPSKAFTQGLIVQLSNPKALLYFSALLPQFIDPSEPVLFQLFLMGVTCIAADIVVYSLFGQMASQLVRKQAKPWVLSAINKAAGITLLATGIKMAALETAR